MILNAILNWLGEEGEEGENCHQDLMARAGEEEGGQGQMEVEESVQFVVPEMEVL